MRHVICHYHIYKNSGTTFDGMLSANFNERHICFDGPFPFFAIPQRELGKIIQRHPSVVAFSSHQISLPVPASIDFNVLPVVFIRHPLLRALSIYKFKREERDGTRTSVNAQAMEFDAWCMHTLKSHQESPHISNAQTRMLGGTYGQPALSKRTATGMTYDVHQARRNLASVELVARTEYFAQDVARFHDVLATYGIEFCVQDTTPKNVTASDFEQTVTQRLEQLAELLSDSTHQALTAANQQDLALYDEVSRRMR